VRAIEVDAERVVERRPAVGPASTNALDEARHVHRSVLRDAHFGVEVDERDVLGLGEVLQEPDGGRAGQTHVLEHAAARVEQQPEPEVQPVRFGLGRVEGIAAEKDRDVLLLAVLEDLEVLRAEIGDEVALAVEHHHGHVHQIDPAPESSLLRGGHRRRQRATRYADEETPHLRSDSADDSRNVYTDYVNWPYHSITLKYGSTTTRHSPPARWTRNGISRGPNRPTSSLWSASLRPSTTRPDGIG
jgi:hypothetical protein